MRFGETWSPSMGKSVGTLKWVTPQIAIAFGEVQVLLLVELLDRKDSQGTGLALWHSHSFNFVFGG